MARNRRSLSSQGGYPNAIGGPAASFDPAMGRGHRIGDRVRVPAGETVTLSNHGLQDHYFRWKVTLSTSEDPDGVYAALTAYLLVIEVFGKAENDKIMREATVGLGRGQVIYVPGRSIQILATNPTDQPLIAQYSLDEATPGLSSWTSDEPIAISAETPLTIPVFAQTLQVFANTGGVGWTIRGYDASGTLAYTEVLNPPRSVQVPIVPSLYYTIQPALAGTHSTVVLYQCVG